MADLTRKRKSRSANRNAADKLSQKAVDKMLAPFDEEVRLDLEVLMRSIKAKETLLLKLDDDILN